MDKKVTHCSNQIKNKQYQSVGRIAKSNIKIVERGKMDTPNTQIHDHSLSCLGTGLLINSGGVKLILWAQTSLQNTPKEE